MLMCLPDEAHLPAAANLDKRQLSSSLHIIHAAYFKEQRNSCRGRGSALGAFYTYRMPQVATKRIITDSAL